MKKNGFTLVELLAVIVILGVLSMIVFPATTKIIKKAREDSYNVQVSDIITASKKWIMENSESIDNYETNNINLTLTTLKQEGYLKNTFVKNSKSKKYMAGCVVIKYENNAFKYEYKNKDTNYSKLTNENIISIENEEMTGCNERKGFIYTYSKDGNNYSKNISTNNTNTSAYETLKGKVGTNDVSYIYKGLSVSNYLKFENSVDIWRVLKFDENNIYLVNMGTTVGPNPLDNINFSNSNLKSTIATNLTDACYTQEIKNSLNLISENDYENSKNNQGNSYLTPQDSTIWTSTFNENNIKIINSTGIIDFAYNNIDIKSVYPTIQISSITNIIDSGEGTSSDPYIINSSN